MRGLRIASLLWLIGGVLSALLVLVTIDMPLTALLLAGGGIVGLSIGVLLWRRPSADVLRWSRLAGFGWLVAFGWLTISNLSQPADEWLSVLVLTALGGLGSLLAYARRTEATTRS
jgi:hypothetical protein